MTDETRQLIIQLVSHMAYMQSQLEDHHPLYDYGDCRWYRESVRLRSLAAEVLEPGEVAELAAELRHFIAGYQQMRGLDPEHIYSIHRGDAMEAHLRISRLSRIAELLERTHAGD